LGLFAPRLGQCKSPTQADEGKKELPYWLSMCCQGLSEEFLNNFHSKMLLEYLYLVQYLNNARDQKRLLVSSLNPALL